MKTIVASVQHTNCLYQEYGEIQMLQIRQELARADYHDLTSTDHQSRLLDDLWPQFWAINPKLDDVQETIILLKTLEGEPRFHVATRVEMELRQVIKEFTDFINSSHVVEVLRPASTVPVVSTHTTCPLPPFIPYICQFAPAGYLRIVLHATLAYMRYVLHPFILSEIESQPHLGRPASLCQFDRNMSYVRRNGICLCQQSRLTVSHLASPGIGGYDMSTELANVGVA